MVDLGSSGISAAPAPVLSLQQLCTGSVGAAAAGGKQVVVCSTDGTAHLLTARHSSQQQQQQQQQEVLSFDVRGSVALPGEVFSSPVSCGPWVVVGCRDDYLYCLACNSSM
jgi:acyl-CoA synthetase